MRLASKPAVVLALVGALVAGAAGARDGLRLSDASVDELLSALMGPPVEWSGKAVVKELRARAGSDPASFESSGLGALAQALAATTAQGRNVRANGCHEAPWYCAAALEASVQVQPLQERPVEALAQAAATGLAIEHGATRYLLGALAAVAANQRLPDAAAAHLVGAVLNESTSSRNKPDLQLRDVLVKAAGRGGLSMELRSRLLETLTADAGEPWIAAYGPVFVTDTLDAITPRLRAERLRHWLTHHRTAAGDSLLAVLFRSRAAMETDVEYRRVLFTRIVDGDEGRLKLLCPVLRKLLSGGRATEAELVELVHVAASRGGRCSVDLLGELALQLKIRKERGDPIPSARLFPKVTPHIVPYSEDLSTQQISFVGSAIGVIGYLAPPESLSEELMDHVIGWFGVTGWGVPALMAGASDGRMREHQANALITAALADNGARTHARHSGMSRIMAGSSLPVSGYDQIGRWLLDPRNHPRRKAAVGWLHAALKNGHMDDAMIAERALLHHADAFEHTGFLAPLLGKHADRPLLTRIATLAVETGRVDLVRLLSAQTLPDFVLEQLAPLMDSTNRTVSLEVVRLHADRSGSDPGWLQKASFNEEVPTSLRIEHVRRLAGSVHLPQVRDALLGHLRSSSAPLRRAALTGLRHAEIDRTTVQAATEDPDSDIQREAWRQTASRFGEEIPRSQRWRLYPGSAREDLAGALVLAAMVSGIIGVLSFLFAAVLAGALASSLVILLVGAIATLVGYAMFVLPMLGSQHVNGMVQAIDLWIITLIVYWLLIGLAWFSIWKQRRGLSGPGVPQAQRAHA